MSISAADMLVYTPENSPWCSRTIRTARSRTSGEDITGLLMTPSSQDLEPPTNSGRFTQVLARVCLDTAPTAFPAGTQVCFTSYGSEIVNIRGPVPPTVTVNNWLRFPALQQQGRLPVRLVPGLARRRDDARTVGEGLLSDRHPVQRAELSGVDHGGTHVFLVTPESTRHVELCGFRGNGFSRAWDGVRHPLLRAARHPGPHGDRADGHVLDLPGGRRDRRVRTWPLQQSPAGEDSNLRGLPDPRGDPGDRVGV